MTGAAVHIVGAGLAGLSAAVRLAAGGARVVVHEGAGHAGGRCRSLYDQTLGCIIDNGNHLILSGNTSVMAYVDAIGARDSLIVAEDAAFPFVDLATGERWTVRPNRGRLPWWIFVPSRRAPRTRARDYLAARRLRRAGADETVAACLDSGSALFARFWEPLAVAILNTAVEEAAARLLWPVAVEIFGRGGRAARPCLAREGLSATFVAPALARLEALGADVRFGRRLKAVETDGPVATALHFPDGTEWLSRDDRVILALPPAAAARVLPQLTVPRDSRPIVNAHFRPDTPPPPGDAPFLGMVGGLAQWLFVRGPVISVTVSAATALVDHSTENIAQRLWIDVARALGREPSALPPWRVVKEKRATFAQTPASVARRPGTRTAYRNLFLAGDWTDTGLPATLESAVRSGHAAARAVTSS